MFYFKLDSNAADKKAAKKQKRRNAAPYLKFLYTDECHISLFQQMCAKLVYKTVIAKYLTDQSIK